MKLHKYIFAYLMLLFFSLATFASDKVELDTTVIKGNRESPAILYIVPWKKMKIYNDEYQGLIIGDLQGGILTPSLPGRKLLVR